VGVRGNVFKVFCENDLAVNITGADRILLEREASLAGLKAAGADIIDTSAAELPLALAQRYGEIKRRGRL
jgi:hypothetical protein